MWFYSLPRHDNLCRAADSLYADYLGAVRYGNVFALDVGPDYDGRLRDIDVRTLRTVGRMIRAGVRAEPVVPPLSDGCPASASSVWDAPGYEAHRAFDGNDSTRWGAAPGSRSGWVAVDLGAPRLVAQVTLKELGFHRTRRFIVEVSGDGHAWRAVSAGETISGVKVVDFPATEARYVRLNVLAADEVPTIEAIEVRGPVGASGSRSWSLR